MMDAVGERFVTKDSGKRQEFETGMVRDTQDGKARFDLLFPVELPYSEQLLTRFADLMARGAVKYAERNWEQARTPEELARYKASALRHLIQWLTGEVDEDHAAAVMFNLMGAEYVKSRMHAEVSTDLANAVAAESEKAQQILDEIRADRLSAARAADKELADTPSRGSCGVFSQELRGFCVQFPTHTGRHMTGAGEPF